MPICKKCPVEQSGEEFTKDPAYKTGHRNNCKECYNAKRKEAYKRPDIYESLVEYRAENSERNKEYQKEYAARNKEILSEKRKKKYLEKKLSSLNTEVK